MLGIGTPYPLIHCLARPSPLPLHAPAPSIVLAFSFSTQQFLPRGGILLHHGILLHRSSVGSAALELFHQC